VRTLMPHIIVKMYPGRSEQRKFDEFDEYP
jgi:hypothetical protein